MVIKKGDYDPGKRNIKSEKTFAVMNFDTSAGKSAGFESEKISEILDDIFSSPEFNKYLKDRKNEQRIDVYKKEIAEQIDSVEDGVDKSDFVAYIIEFLGSKNDKPKEVISILGRILRKINEDEPAPSPYYGIKDGESASVEKDKDVKSEKSVQERNKKELGADNSGVDEVEKLSQALDAARKKIDSARKILQKKEEEVEKQKSFFKRVLFKDNYDLGQTERDIELLKKDLEENQAAFEQLQSEYDLKTKPAAGENIEEHSDLTEAEIEAMPAEKKKKLGLGLSNIGFFVEEQKNKLFAKVTGSLVGLKEGENIAEKGMMARIMHSLTKDFQEKADKARHKIDNNEGLIKGASSVGFLFGNLIKHGRWITDLTKHSLSSPLRYVMMGAMALGTGANAFKEARLSGQENIDKTRIGDADVAAEEAWKLYEQSRGGDKDAIPSREDIEKHYRKNVPKDVLDRLNSAELSFAATGLAGFVIGKDVQNLTARINKKLGKIENNNSLSKEEKEMAQEKILNSYSEYLDMFDKMVSQAGEIDALAMAGQYIKTGAKAAVYAVGIETIALMTQKLLEESPNIMQGAEKVMKSVDDIIKSHDVIDDMMMDSHGAGISDGMMSSHEPNAGMSPVTNEFDNIDEKIGYQGGKSVWAEAEKQLAARMKDSFDNLGGGDAKMAEALKTINVDRLKNVIVGDPEKYGLPKGIDFNRMSAEQIGSIAWGSAIKDAVGDVSGLTESVSPEDAQSIVNNNEALREALQSNVEAPGVENIVETSTTSASENAAEVISGTEGVSGSAEYERFLEESIKGISINITDASREVRNIFDKYPDLERMSGAELNRTFAGINIVEDHDRYNSLKRIIDIRRAYGKQYIKIYNSFFGLNQIEIGSVEKIPAEEFISENPESKAVKVFESLKKVMSPKEASSLDPMPEETTEAWAQRIIDKTLRDMNKK